MSSPVTPAPCSAYTTLSNEICAVSCLRGISTVVCSDLTK
jgi:hypothetical protein